MTTVDTENDPVTSIERLLAISEYDLESPEVREHLNELARRAAEECHAPIGLVSIVFDTAQYFAGMYGLEGWMAEAQGMPVEWSFCANAVRSGKAYVVADASVDPVQQGNPVVTEDGVRAYAGMPLIAPDGHVLGTVCVVDVAPHAFDQHDVDALAHAAEAVVAELESHARHGADTDQ